MRAPFAYQVDALARAPFLAGVPREELEPLVAGGRTIVHEAGRRLMGELEPGDTIIVILSGRVRICVAASEPTETTLAEVGPGAAIGEVGLLTGRLRSATGIAIERTEALHLRREEVADLVTRFPQIAQVFSRDLAKRLVETDLALSRALKCEADALGPLDPSRRAEVAGEGKRGLLSALVAAFREVVLEHRTELPFFFLSGFLAALVFARIAVYVGEKESSDPRFLLRDLYVAGLLLLLVSGACAHFVFHRTARRLILCAYGVAIGLLANELSVLLSFDVFYLDTTTRDPDATFSITELYDRASTRYAVLLVIVVAIQATYMRTFYRRAFFLVSERIRRRLRGT